MNNNHKVSISDEERVNRLRKIFYGEDDSVVNASSDSCLPSLPALTLPKQTNWLDPISENHFAPKSSAEPQKTEATYYGENAEGKEIIFKEQQMEGEGDCGFLALEASREDITAMLLSLAPQKEMQERYGIIIQSALLNKEWKYNQAEWDQLNKAMTRAEQALKTLLDELFAHYNWDSTVDHENGETPESRHQEFLDVLEKMQNSFLCLASDEKQTLDFSDIQKKVVQFNLPENQLMVVASIVERVAALTYAKKVTNDIRDLQEKINALKAATDARKQFCENEAILTAYAMDFCNESLKKKLWLDMTSMILYAEHNQLKLYIWEETHEKKKGKKVLAVREKSLLDEDSVQGLVATKHVLFSKGIHFNRLIEVAPQVKQQQFPVSFVNNTSVDETKSSSATSFKTSNSAYRLSSLMTVSKDIYRRSENNANSANEEDDIVNYSEDSDDEDENADNNTDSFFYPSTHAGKFN